MSIEKEIKSALFDAEIRTDVLLRSIDNRTDYLLRNLHRRSYRDDYVMGLLRGCQSVASHMHSDIVNIVFQVLLDNRAVSLAYAIEILEYWHRLYRRVGDEEKSMEYLNVTYHLGYHGIVRAQQYCDSLDIYEGTASHIDSILSAIR